MEGHEIAGEEEEGFRFASACLRAEKAALRLITRAEQNVCGLTRKLEKRGCKTACVRAVIARLSETGLLDDYRYACLWLESRISRRASSPWRLLVALRSRGVDRNDANWALREILDDEAEYRLLERFTEKLRRGNKTKEYGNSAAALQSLKSLLKSEGFSTLAIQRFIDS
jgi:regulatory protein